MGIRTHTSKRDHQLSIPGFHSTSHLHCPNLWLLDWLMGSAATFPSRSLGMGGGKDKQGACVTNSPLSQTPGHPKCFMCTNTEGTIHKCPVSTAGKIHEWLYLVFSDQCEHVTTFLFLSSPSLTLGQGLPWRFSCWAEARQMAPCSCSQEEHPWWHPSKQVVLTRRWPQDKVMDWLLLISFGDAFWQESCMIEAGFRGDWVVFLFYIEIYSS